MIQEQRVGQLTVIMAASGGKRPSFFGEDLFQILLEAVVVPVNHKE